MAPFSVADLKQRATKVKDASVHKYQDTRDRYSSQPAAKTKWDPNYKTPPPPPPSRTSIGGGAAPRPPPVARHSRPQLQSQTHEEETAIDQIDWANLSPEDKQVFFSWLDEFFARYLNKAMPPRSVGGSVRHTNASPSNPISRSTSSSPARSSNAPPKIPSWSKPATPPTNISTSLTSQFTLSYPPPTTHGSAALDLAHYFHPSTHWSLPWYQTEHMPPVLHGKTNLAATSGYETHGTKKLLFGGIFFSDLSICWWSVRFDTSASDDPNDAARVERSAQYLPLPRQMSKAELVDAHETYGETIAAFAESFDGAGEFCGRGECWDLAHEAIKYFDAFDYVPKPVPSLSRTHGHLIFEGKAMGKGSMVGRWRGGDTLVRRGDIVEWREVKINVVNASRHSWVTLGVPDHTAVIVSDSPLSREPVDGESFSPADIGTIEVVEQSVNDPTSRKTYDMNAFEKGEMWIYRPVGMQAYLNTLMVARCPVGVQALTL